MLFSALLLVKTATTANSFPANEQIGMKMYFFFKSILDLK
jgi:hypothetical protein